MSMDDHYKTVYHIVGAAQDDMHRMATDLGQAAEDDLSAMRNVAGFAWNGSNSEEMSLKYAQTCKNTGSYADDAHGTAGSYGNVVNIGQTCETQVSNIIGI
ncbi:hypothetical protein DMH03_14735 [Amycolatopsis sp. WAC 01376]|uniref:hypothetical protein n=1 Tax=Amycolatopsis sp. WAC 01376 TaxID=2203195 RepID=UPI000F7B931E|nr:hypothetical protein [Amycolatopsis sp. WAC 01376]RSM63255.1 hypothetical protein DMH03_14735 [Amycolatopsis sp. WAC 01376]